MTPISFNKTKTGAFAKSGEQDPNVVYFSQDDHRIYLNGIPYDQDSLIDTTYANLTSLANNDKLIPGTFYRIIDYTCTTSSPDTLSAGHVFDVIVRADSTNTLGEDARAAIHAGDTYFINNKLSAWKLKYCLQNDESRFAWASSNGTGVIYYMKDEFGNEASYDFKNILFINVNNAETAGVYTFSSDIANPTDTSLNKNNAVYCNVIEPRYEGGIQHLNNIVCIGNNTHDNIFAHSCHHIYIARSYACHFSGCHNITFGTETEIDSYYRYIRIDSNNNRIFLHSITPKDPSNYCQNITVESGSNIGSDYRLIQITGVNQSSNTKITASGSSTYVLETSGTSSIVTDSVIQNDTIELLAYTDLSKQDYLGNATDKTNTANCYIVRTSGKYTFPLVYGNAIKNSANNTPAYTKQDGANATDFVNHLVTPISSPWLADCEGAQIGDLFVLNLDNSIETTGLKIFNSKGNLYAGFEIKSIPDGGGNLLIGVKDTSNRVMWSWHIWIIPASIELGTFNLINFNGTPYEILTYILGVQLDTSTYTVDGKSYCKTYKNLFYQFGRKDPLRTTNVDTVTGSNLTTTISDSIQNPEKFYCLLNNDEENGMYDWCVEHASNLWDANRTIYSGNESSCIKTIYDPCPVGFIVPNVQWSYGFTDGIVSTTNASRFQVIGEFQNGWMMKRNPQDTQGIFMPASGYRDNATGNVDGVGSQGGCWSVASYEPGFAYRLAFMHNYIGPRTGPSRTFGCSVRPVREL